VVHGEKISCVWITIIGLGLALDLADFLMDTEPLYERMGLRLLVRMESKLGFCWA
jgi:hypothetical protein